MKSPSGCWQAQTSTLPLSAQEVQLLRPKPLSRATRSPLSLAVQRLRLRKDVTRFCESSPELSAQVAPSCDESESKVISVQVDWKPDFCERSSLLQVQYEW